jgi:hypothetical protein
VNKAPPGCGPAAEQIAAGRRKGMSLKETQEKLAENMKKWQVIEDASMASTGRIMEQTNNPLIRLVMEIIQNDSRTHRMVQEFIYASLRHEPVALAVEDIAAVSDGIDKHNELEKKMISYVENLLGDLKEKQLIVQGYLLNYLKDDEHKHLRMLSALDSVKKGVYPYASS